MSEKFLAEKHEREERLWRKVEAFAQRIQEEGYDVTIENRDNTFAVIYPDHSEEHFMKFEHFPVSDTTGATEDIIAVMEKAIKESGKVEKRAEAA